MYSFQHTKSFRSELRKILLVVAYGFAFVIVLASRSVTSFEMAAPALLIISTFFTLNLKTSIDGVQIARGSGRLGIT